MYVFDKKYLYFLTSRYGRKMEYFAANPQVSVEMENIRRTSLHSPL